MSVDVPRVRAATGQFPPLPGEREEQAPPKPYPMRAAGMEGTSTHPPEVIERSKRRRRAVKWIIGGSSAGLLAFVMLYLSPPPWVPYPFPPVHGTVETPHNPLPAGVQPEGVWVLSGDYYIGSSPRSIYVLEAGMGETPEFRGELEIGSVLGDERPVMITMVSEPSIDGVVLSWFDGKRLHWRPLGDGTDRELTRLAPGALIGGGEFYIRRDRDEILYPPSRLHDWNRSSPEKFVVALRQSNPERFFLKLIDPTDPRPDLRNEEIDAPFIAPPISQYDAKADRSLVLVATRRGVFLYEEGSDGQLDPAESAGASALFQDAERWKSAGAAAWMKIRTGDDRHGWLLASAGDVALVTLDGDLRLKIETTEPWETGAGDKAAAPTLLTYPDADRPEYDQAVVAQKSGYSVKLLFDGGGNLQTRRIHDTGASIAAADINGDAIWDIISISADGTVRIIDGVSGQRVETAITPSPAPPGGNSVLWTYSDSAISAFYMSAKHNPIRIRIPFQWTAGETWRDLTERDRKWRLGMLPDRAETEGAG